jgi:aerobic carbon-monoxide dehydrogenase large subunit
LLTALVDDALPGVAYTLSFAFKTRNVPCTINPVVVKGAGEVGAIGAARPS